MTNIPIGLIGIFIILPMIINLIVTAVIAHKYVETIESHLPNCSFVSTIREAWSGGGVLGKLIRGGVMTIVMMMPNLCAKKGIIDINEMNRLPVFYKRLLIIPMLITFTLFTAMMALRIAGYLLGL
ncbi:MULTISPECIES: hypothetical protein [unclassified Pseudomonas]|uniref:hypothetical protein n=1 Tax=unclassified Pseudomonas TaxID=196821 RepID=UPI0015A48EC3|nr:MULTISPECIES: hypothetical protein [unclassified Pseudomonas]NWC92373.1 hypothetical protein [Pseudomonas sp. IPO3779]NWD19845.1 hypothetical protein [Pseudomonas sp. IPO3778]